MEAASSRLTEEEDEEQGMDQQDIFDRMVLFLATLTLRLVSRVLGADDPPFGPVMRKRGDAGTAGVATTGTGSSSGATTVATSASATPSRWARARCGPDGRSGCGEVAPGLRVRSCHHTQGWRVLESASVSYGRATPYFPVIDLLKRYYHLEDGDAPRTRRAKVTGQVLTLDETLQDTPPALLALLDALPTTARF